MKSLFLLGIVVGLAATLAGARFYPFASPTRVASHTSVVANGGRAERFVVRLPADRIAANGSRDAGLRGAAFPEGAELPEELLERPVLIEQFKVRDRTGSVIGVAARHWTEIQGVAAAAWLVVIPSRGAMLLAAQGEARGAVESAIAPTGYRVGKAWSGQAEVVATAGGTETGRILSGSGEFERLDGRYAETWEITGVRASGELQGTITLDTVTYRSDASAGGMLEE